MKRIALALLASAVMLMLPAPSAGAATTVPPSPIVGTVTITPLDPATGVPVAAPTTHQLTAAEYFRQGFWQGRPTYAGRALFSVDITHDLGCIFVCFTSYHHITQVDLAWVAPWRWVHANAWAKYTPVGSTWVHYGGDSQAYGGDTTGYYADYFGFPTSGFHYRGTAQNVFNIPGIGDAFVQDANDLWIRWDGLMYWTGRHTG